MFMNFRLLLLVLWLFFTDFEDVVGLGMLVGLKKSLILALSSEYQLLTCLCFPRRHERGCLHRLRPIVVQLADFPLFVIECLKHGLDLAVFILQYTLELANFPHEFIRLLQFLPLGTAIARSLSSFTGMQAGFARQSVVVDHVTIVVAVLEAGIDGLLLDHGSVK